MGTESSFATGTRATCGLQQNKASWDLWVNITFNSWGSNTEHGHRWVATSNRNIFSQF